MNFETIKKIFIYIIALYPFFSYICTIYIVRSPIVVLLIISFLILVLIIDKKKYKIYIPRYIMYIILFGLYYLFLRQYKYSEFSLNVEIYKNPYFRVSIVLIVLENLKISKEIMNNLTILLKFLLIIGAVASILQLIVNPVLFTIVDNDEGNIRLSNYWKYVTGGRHPSIYGMIGGDSLSKNLPLIFSLVLGVTIRLDKSSKYIYSVLAGLSIIISRWRIALFGYLIVILQFAFVKKKRSIIVLILLTIIVIILFSYSLDKYTNISFEETFQNRLTSSSAETRLYALTLFKKYFIESMFLGTGGENLRDLQNEIQGRTYGIHVGYLSILYYFGVIGGGLFFMINYHIYKELKKTMNKSNYHGAYFGFLAFLSINLTDFNFSFFHMGFFLCIIYNKYYREQIYD